MKGNFKCWPRADVIRWFTTRVLRLSITSTLLYGCWAGSGGQAYPLLAKRTVPVSGRRNTRPTQLPSDRRSHEPVLRLGPLKCEEILKNITLANSGYLFSPGPGGWPTRGMVSRSVNQSVCPHFPTQPKLQLGFTTKLVEASRMARGRTLVDLALIYP